MTVAGTGVSAGAPVSVTGKEEKYYKKKTNKRRCRKNILKRKSFSIIWYTIIVVRNTC